MIDVRPPTEDDRQEIADLLYVSLNLDRARQHERLPWMQLQNFLCAYDGDRIVATTAVRPFRQWFGGRELSMAGVYAVVTQPERRGTGLASRLVAQCLHAAREQGTSISCLYPATLRPYRNVGFELAGTYTEHRVPLDDLPDLDPELAVDEYQPADVDAIRACYRQAVSHHHGPIDCDEEDWWPKRILSPATPSQVGRVVVVRDGDGVAGYASFRYAKDAGQLDVSFAVECQHLVAATPAALGSLFAYFRGFRGLGTALEWPGPPVDAAAFLVDEQRVVPAWTFRWMARLLDVPGALESRGYAPVDGEAVIAVDDAMFADNRGPFHVVADRGKVRVTRTDAKARDPIPIGVLSSLFTGYVSARDAARTGVLRVDDDTVAFLSELLAGPAPWMLDWF